jgi:hypothetical protein
MSTSFQPETNGQTEQVNQTIEVYVRSYCAYEQNNWVGLLRLAGFACNNSVTTATSLSSFYTNIGVHRRASWPTKEEPKNPNLVLLRKRHIHFILLGLKKKLSSCMSLAVLSKISDRAVSNRLHNSKRCRADNSSCPDGHCSGSF